MFYYKIAIRERDVALSGDFLIGGRFSPIKSPDN